MSGRRREAFLTAGVGLAAVAIQLPIFDRWLALLDEGYLLELADEVNRGKLLYRDVYVDAPLPGAFYAMAAWFRIAGTSIWSSRLLAVALFALLAMLLFRVGRAVLPSGWALVLAALVLCYRIWAFPHWHIVSYSSLAATLLTAALVLALRHVATGSRAAVLASGALVGAAILCKQDYGVGVGGALGLFFVARPFVGSGSFAPAALYAAGGALVVLPAFAAVVTAGLLGPLVEQTFVRPLALVSSFGYAHLPPVRPVLHQAAALRADIGSYFPAILLTLGWNEIAAGWVYRETPLWDLALKLAFYAPFVVWGAAALLWARGARRLLVLAYAAGFLVAFDPPRDWVHLMMVFPPTLVLGTALVAEASTRAPRVAAGLAALGLAAAATVSAGLAADLRHQFAWPLHAPRAGIRADARHGPIIEDILAHIAAHAPPGTPVPVWPVQPMLEFLAGREGAGGFHVIWPGQDPARDRRIIADLERRDVRVIVYSLSQYAHLRRFRDNAPKLYAHLVHHWTIERVFTREAFGPLFCALGRRAEPPPGRPLVERLPPGALSLARWPFATVMAERVGTPDAAVLARLPLDVPTGRPRLTFAYGTNPDRWLEFPSGPFTFTVAIEDGDSAATTVLREELDPYRRLEDRRWVDASVDLSAWAGRRVMLALSITAPAEPPAPTDIAGWAEPRLVAR